MMKQSTGIGILIRNRRKELGINQAELFKSSTLSQAHVSRIESGISGTEGFLCCCEKSIYDFIKRLTDN